ncbi:MAG: diguanylate cyclase [Actinobacteria bacterium]|nr:diguanylate cyclase [Actinomycetota bacterium]
MKEDKDIRILLNVDSEDDALLFLNKIKRKGYNPKYKIVKTYKDVSDAIIEDKWDVILADYNLSSDFNLLDILKMLKESNLDIPSVIVSDVIGEEKAISLTMAGADNYVMKKNLSRLVPVIEKEIRNAKSRSRQKKALEKLKENERYFRSLVENASDIIYRHRLIPGPEYEYVSPSVRRNLGYTPEQYYADPEFNYKIVYPGDREIFKKILDGNFNFSKPVEIRLIHKNGKVIWFEETITPFFNKEGKLEVIEGILHNISGRKKMEKRLSYMSFHDSLTTLYNRAYFEEELKRLDTKRQLPLSIIIGDINGLKLINDAFGHKEGDRLLKSCGNILKNCCRAEDIVARWGGDEFSMLLPRTNEEFALEIVSRIRKKSSKTSGGKIPLSIAIGFSTKSKNHQDFEKIIKKAEDDMYRNKLIEAKSIISSIISSLEKTLFEKSVKTEKHTKRIKEMALELGKSIKLRPSEIDELSLLATIHDIGKVAILDVILNKKENLSKREWDIIKRHPEIGYRIAVSSKQLSSIAEYILTGHEWWDGNGYPQGLKGENIPVLSRIIAIVDAYEVMITGRPYKKAISKEEAIAELKKCSGTQFDPELVKRFVKILESKSKY